MRSKFDGQLALLNEEMIRMGTMIEENIAKAVEVLGTQNTQLARQIMEKDSDVDQAQKNIENLCFNLLIQQQPVARDLRTITAALKMVTDMERIGDHAADICELTLFMGNVEHEAKLDNINRMASETVLMLNWSIEAYVERNRAKALEVIAHDDVVDELFCQVKRDIISLILADPKAGEEATDLLMAAKYFERIGDHATNIAEWVIFSMKTSRDDEAGEESQA